MTLLVGYIVRANWIAIRGVIKRMFPVANFFEEDDFSLTPDLSIARGDGILKGLKTYRIHDNPDFNMVGHTVQVEPTLGFSS